MCNERVFKMVLEQLQHVYDDIDHCLTRVGRTDSVTLVAVTKMVDFSLVAEAIRAGVTNIGENKVQELLKKKETFGKDLSYHLIGHLQTNKVKKVIGVTSLIHSVDSIRLLEEIDRRSGEQGVITDILAELNIAEETSKTGMQVKELLPFVEHCSSLKYVRLRGLMTMAPYTQDDSVIRDVFRKAYSIKMDIAQRNYDNVRMEHLSMGMSHDYKIAIEEGATIIRVGSKIFGERHYI